MKTNNEKPRAINSWFFIANVNNHTLKENLYCLISQKGSNSFEIP